MRYLRHFFAFTLLLAWTGTSVAQFPKVNPDDLRNSKKIVQTFRPVVAKASESTVRVNVDGKDVAFGTVVDADGYILTKWSEVKDKLKITCTLRDGKILSAKVIGAKDDDKIEGAYDLAMLKVDAKGLKAIEWRPSKDATVGRWVASVSNGEDPVAVGVVSVAKRKFAGGDQPPRKGINPNAGFLGVQLESVMGGAKVSIVTPNSPAAKATPSPLKPGDVIYEAAGKKIVDHMALIETIQRLKAGDKVNLKFKRTEEDLETNVTLGKIDPKMLGNPQETMGTRLSLRRGFFPAIIQHDSGVKPEDCGGPLVDLDGKAIGINIARAGRTESYALASEDILPLFADLKSGKLDPYFVVNATSKLTDQDSTDKKLPGRFLKVQEVKMSAGGVYAIELKSNDFDAYLVIQDAKGNKLAEDNDSGGGLNAKLMFTPPADGLYKVIVSTFNANEMGDYTLTVRRILEAEKK
ncbi:MAG: PDZ domain-containing protein [Gemmataceae bacterium]|nr:PDZ domain-containing protein [Gemmataceae bacterium]